MMAPPSTAYSIRSRTRVPTLVFDEGVLVNPSSIGSLHLLVDKPVRGLPGCDLRAPSDRKHPDAQLVVDEGPLLHFNRQLGENVEMKPGGSQLVQVLRPGEKGKDFRR